MNVFVDIDGTIARTCEDDYMNAEPIEENIKKINSLFDKGFVITYWTARGSSSGKDWFYITQRQLNEWGCKYHFLRMGKPSFDMIIDDKAVKISDL